MICARRSTGCATGWSNPWRGCRPTGSDAGEIERAIAETDQLIGTFNALLLIAETDAGTARGAMSPLDLASVAGRCQRIVRAAGRGEESHPDPGCRPASR